MQLRVARLCLDCEELYAGDCCPVCASERYAFLSRWLPSEERRRWRRPPPQAGGATRGPLQAFMRLINIHGWFGDSQADTANRMLRTRASDHVPNLNFDNPAGEPENRSASTREPAKVLPPRT